MRDLRRFGGEHTANKCLCYTSDRAYALPTVLSAAQARRHLSAQTDVVIVLVGAAPDEYEALAEACVSVDVVLVSVPRDAIDNMPMVLARHFLDRILDLRYRRVTYIDGDTQVHGSLDALLNTEPAPGRVIATPDPMVLMIDKPGPAWASRRRYFASIGIGPQEMRRYVNAGMFSARRDDLAAIGPECRRLTLQAGKRFKFSEQDAFNVLLGPSIDHASLRWNYPAFFSNFKFGDLVEPRVRHFMSNPRPWQGPFAPWGREGYTPYDELLRSQPQLARFHAPFTKLQTLRYVMQQRFKRVVEPWSWDRSDVRAHIQRIESSAIV